MKSSSTENSKRHSSFKTYKKDVLDLNYDSDYSVKNKNDKSHPINLVKKKRSHSSGSVTSNTYSRTPSVSTRNNSPVKKSLSNTDLEKSKLSNTYTKSLANKSDRHSYSSQSRSRSSRSRSRSLSPPDTDYKKINTKTNTLSTYKAKSMDNNFQRKQQADSSISKRSDPSDLF